MAQATILQVLILCAIVSSGYGYGNGCNFNLTFTNDIFGLDFINEAFTDESLETTILFNFTLPSNVTDCDLSSYYGENKYIKGFLEGRQIVVKPTEAFQKLEYELDSSKKNTTLEFAIECNCGDGWGDTTEFSFIQPITDTNNHEPMFNRKEYVYHFGMDIKEGAVLTEVMEIYAVDIDITNTELEFGIEANENIAIKYDESTYDNKIHYAKLVTTKPLVAGKTYKHKITAKDFGYPQKIGSAVVKIIID